MNRRWEWDLHRVFGYDWLSICMESLGVQRVKDFSFMYIKSTAGAYRKMHLSQLLCIYTAIGSFHRLPTRMIASNVHC